MTKNTHKAYIILLSSTVVLTFVFLLVNGLDYYKTTIHERFFHTDYLYLKPSGILGHGLGIFGTLAMMIGIISYMLRKRMRRLSRLGLLKHWLEFHIFLCTLGPIMVLFHTSFKFGGIVSISFWSMVAVFLSGIIGRFIYIQIPRTIEGRELSLYEVTAMKNQLSELLSKSQSLNDESFAIIQKSTKKKVEKYYKNIVIKYVNQFINDWKSKKMVNLELIKNKLTKEDRKQVFILVKSEISLHRRIERLDTMKNLFKYWHVAHLPFAFSMIVIMIIHVTITLIFGYKWIF